MRLLSFAFGLLMLAACRPTPPSAPAPRYGTPVAASFGRTWDATIDAFAERGISIETLDRSSGLIVPAGRSYAPGQDIQDALRYADCGKTGWGNVNLPFSVKYNVVVRGDSSRANVVVRAFYRGIEGDACSSKGLFESEAEANIKDKAEGGSSTPLSEDPCSTPDSARRVGADWVVSLHLRNGISCTSIPCTIPGAAARGTEADAIALCKEDHSLWRIPRQGQGERS